MIAKASNLDGGINHMSTGSFVSDGTAITLQLGYNPAQIQLFNLTDTVVWETLNSMPAGTTIKTIGAGTTTVDATSAIVFNGDGTVTISAAAVPTGKTIAWTAQL